MRNYEVYLKDILNAMKSIEEFMGDMDFEELKTDDKTASAVIRKFEIIGEVTKHIPSEIRQKYSQIPWKEMAGMRDRLIHFYFGIEHKLIWRTIKERMPEIKPLLRKIVEEYGKSK